MSRENLLNWGLWEMNWTLTIDQLFNCFYFFNRMLSRCNTWIWFAATAAFRQLILCPVVAVSCLLVCCMLEHTHLLCCCCSLHLNTVQTATICCYRRKQLIHFISSVLTVAVRTPILCEMQQQETNTMLTATTGHYNVQVTRMSLTPPPPPPPFICGRWGDEISQAK